MDYVIKIMAPAERNYCYTDSQQLDKQTGCIGHLRGDMDKKRQRLFHLMVGSLPGAENTGVQGRI